MKNKLKWILNSYLLAIIVQWIVGYKKFATMDYFEMVQVLMLTSLILSPLMGILIFSIKFSGLPLLNEFVRGGKMTRILIAIIVTLLIGVQLI